MSHEEEQSILLSIVETWRLSEKPEYRGFRCANCQQYKNKAWYHWVNTGGYKLPIHMCEETCEPAFQNRTIVVDTSKRQVVDRSAFGNSYHYNPEAIKTFRKIVTSWIEHEVDSSDPKPVLKAFSCDLCYQDLIIDSADGLRKGYHVWWKIDDERSTLAELHFHKECASSIGISE